MITDINMIKMMCISCWSLLNKSLPGCTWCTHSHCRAMFYNTSATVFMSSWAQPWLEVYWCTHLNPFKDLFALYSETNFSVRRADAEKPGCLIFIGGLKNLTKNTKSHPKHKEQSENFIPTSRYCTDSTYTVCLLQSKRICAAIWKLPTYNPSPATLLGWSDNTQHGFMASRPLWWDAWIQTRHTHLSSPVSLPCS